MSVFDSAERFMITDTGTIVFFVIILIALCTGIGLLTLFVNKTAATAKQKTEDKLRDWSQRFDVEKELTAARVAEEEGETNAGSFMNRIDTLLRQSGLKRKFVHASPVLFIAISILTCVLGAVIGYVLLQHAFSIMLGSAAGLFLPYIAISIVAKTKNDRVQEMLLIFCDTAINFSATITSLPELLRKSGDYMDEPLRSALIDANSEAIYGTGGTWMALYHLKQRVSNHQFSAIIQDLELASHYDADYQKVLKDRKSILESHLASETKKRQMLSSSRVNIGIMILVCIVCINSMSDLIEGGMWTLLLTDPVGMILLLVAIIIVGYAIKVCFTTPSL